MQLQNTPVFLALTDFTGEPLLLATSHIISIDSEHGREPVVHEHNSFDPDCHCTDCLGHPCECSDWWHQTRITLDLVAFGTEEDPPERQDRMVRETVGEIAAMLRPAPYCGTIERTCGDQTCNDVAHLRVKGW